MEQNYSAFIDQFLHNAESMKPIPTHLNPVIHSNGKISAVILDIYGTMLISASGDVEESVISAGNIKTALEKAGIAIMPGINEAALLANMLTSFRQQIEFVHTSEKTKDNPYPEVDVLDIWEKILRERKERNELMIHDELCIKCFTFVFEVLSNNVYPMPGMKDVIRTLKSQGIPLGIISNAQFYTPLILNHFLDNPVTEEHIVPFDPDITVLSYQYRRSKPDLFLFRKVSGKCSEKYGISPDQVLFVGNDKFRDIYPASEVGFKTALFAGDKRSLRMRAEIPEVVELNSDYIITDLKQILKIVTP